MRRTPTAANRTNSIDPKPTPAWRQRLLLKYSNLPFEFLLFLMLVMLMLLVG
jgi:hypothetical protein